MDIDKIIGLMSTFFPDLGKRVQDAKNLINGTENNFDSVCAFIRNSNITNEQIEKVANIIQTHPRGKMLGKLPFKVAEDIRKLKSGTNNTDTHIAPKMVKPTQSKRCTRRL